MKKASEKEPNREYDLTDCDREPIHILNQVQNFGFLLALSSDWLVAHVSSNAANFINIDPKTIIGSPARQIFDHHAIERINAQLRFLRGGNSVTRVRDLVLQSGRAPFDVTAHRSDGYIVLEAEPARNPASHDEEHSQVKFAISQLRDADSVKSMAEDAVRFLKTISGFDRVMLYRFRSDDSGEVIAEQKEPGMEPFLNLRYPASDIPKQARALYVRQPIRLIADVDETPAEIIPARGAQGDPLDLSLSALRSVSPIHLEYLRNMGVCASMSVSVIVGGKLWGLFACHHNEPHAPDHTTRGSAELFGHMFSLLLDVKLRDEELATNLHAQNLTARITSTLSTESEPIDSLMTMAREFFDVVRCDGVGIWIDDSAELEGETPAIEEFRGLVRFLNTASENKIYSTEEIGRYYEPGRDFRDRAAGMIAIPISKRPRDYIVFFRREIIKSVRWAGDPDKPVTVGKHGVRLTPRKSFDIYRSIVEGQSESWSPAEIQACGVLRVSLLEIVLRLTNEAQKQRKQAQEKQELLVAELNHRVRNILTLVQGIISQSRSERVTTEEFIGVLSKRVRALARAHDQITRDNWNPASIKEMIRIEAESFLMEKSERLLISGDDFLLEPAAFSTVALVLHELVTNAAKYGALKGKNGEIRIGLEETHNGSLQISWTEQGGPAVQAPTRRGFGSTIIERSIPFDLNGDATIRFDLSGMTARFIIPETFVERVRESAGQGSLQDAETVAWQTGAGQPSKVLIVEDTMIIAMEFKDQLDSLGVTQTEIVSSSKQAFNKLEEFVPDFAFLDVNLGSETSFAIAERLQQRNIPFAFTTGYGDNSIFPDNMKAAPVLSKPCDTADIAGIMNQPRDDTQQDA